MKARAVGELASAIGLSPIDACTSLSGGGNLVCCELDVDPYDFVVRAEADYEDGGESAALNAITNAKRAIVSQMDQALLTFGYPGTAWNLPKKISTLKALGILAPRILERVNSARNLLEHEYRRPMRKDIEDALDLASLFVAAVKPLLEFFLDEFALGNASDRAEGVGFRKSLKFSIARHAKPATFTVTAVVNPGPHPWSGRGIGSTTVDWRDEDVFPLIVRLAIATQRRFHEEEAVQEFCAAVCTPTNP